MEAQVNDVKVSIDEHGNISLKMPLHDGVCLCADICSADKDHKEIYVGLRNKEDLWFQDLAVVREAYHYAKGTPEIINDHGNYEVLVFANELSEDYTHRLTIGEYKEEEEE